MTVLFEMQLLIYMPDVNDWCRNFGSWMFERSVR